MDWRDRIEVDSEVLAGKPVVRGTRIAVEFLLQLLAEGWTDEEILKNYPQLAADDIHAGLQYFRESADEKNVTMLSERDAKTVMALLDDPTTKPNAALIEAAHRYKKRVR